MTPDITCYSKVLQIIVDRLKDSPINWVVTGSFGMALQGVPVDVHDIDLQTDKEGAFEIERRLAEYVINPVRYTDSERIRSYLGMLEIDAIKVEIMGDFQKLVDNVAWEEPVKVECYRHWIAFGEIQVPVLSLEYEVQAYLKLGRIERAELLQAWLHPGNGL